MPSAGNLTAANGASHAGELSSPDSHGCTIAASPPPPASRRPARYSCCRANGPNTRRKNASPAPRRATSSAARACSGGCVSPEVATPSTPLSQNAGPGKYASSGTPGWKTMCGTRPSGHCPRSSDSSSAAARAGSTQDQPIAMYAASQPH
jgi:hypothetical protein